MVLDRAQQLGLQPHRHLADLVEEQDAALSRPEVALRILAGVGERALDVAEELGFG